jgi:hypothetical protein
MDFSGKENTLTVEPAGLGKQEALTVTEMAQRTSS